ncbi:hypothetical protein D3C80_1967950 [compost metagenome]
MLSFDQRLQGAVHGFREVSFLQLNPLAVKAFVDSECSLNREDVQDVCTIFAQFFDGGDGSYVSQWDFIRVWDQRHPELVRQVDGVFWLRRLKYFFGHESYSG